MKNSLPTQLCLDSEIGGKFYVYTLSDTEKVFYVGKGSGKRLQTTLNPNFGNTKSTYKSNKLKKLYQEHKIVVPSVLFTTNNEAKAFEVERELIKYFGKENLCNLTEGGDGLAGLSFSEEHKNKIRQALLGVPLTEERKQNISKAKKGKPAHNKGNSIHPNLAAAVIESNKRRLKYDLTGKSFGWLEVENRETGGWKCKCRCGSHTIVPGSHLRLNRGGRRTCGKYPCKSSYMKSLVLGVI